MSSLKAICDDLALLLKNSHNSQDNLETLFVEGYFNEECFSVFKRLLSLSISESFIESLFIDNEKYDFEHDDEEFDKGSVDWSININKAKLLEKTGYDSKFTAFEEYLFFSDDFLDVAERDFFGFRNPFEPSLLSEDKVIRIQVHGLDVSISGEYLRITPVDDTNVFKKSTHLYIPNQDKIKSTIKLISNSAIQIAPALFAITKGDVGDSKFAIIRNAYKSSLLASLATSFYSQGDISLDGLKHLSVNIGSWRSEDPLECKNLEELISWIYTGDDCETKKQLIADRLALELPQKFNLQGLNDSLIIESLEQAKSKYKFLLAERNEDYRKELKELYSDLRDFSTKLNELCDSISKGLVTDVLSLSFIFSLTVFSRITLGKREFMTDSSIELIFKGVAVYLLVSFVMRFWNANQSLINSERIFTDWSSKLHNHISKEEIKQISEKQLLPPKQHFLTVYVVVGAIHFILAVCSFFYRTWLY
ncbi:hypothetical protein RJ41_10065 [Alteromonas marina]|uniref:Uncharacterized protein n=1 Tax=Alteromonas marina TaxID=203795 RepID=A0A0B3XUQ3_9ALTE|nr:hypothetical protein [Alteromonas marina]KHT52818.1 hypothetical protein RJ41_10065 [Alteromonas marina]